MCEWVGGDVDDGGREDVGKEAGSEAGRERGTLVSGGSPQG